MKILKFGGKSLSNGKGINTVIDIIKEKHLNNEHIVVVVSARDIATNQLEIMLEKAKNGDDYSKDWQEFKAYQKAPFPEIDYDKEYSLLEQVFQGVKMVEDYSPKVKDMVMSQGEILSAKMLSTLLNNLNISSLFIDSRSIFETNSDFGNAKINGLVSEQKTKTLFNDLAVNQVPVVTGYIAANNKNETTTLGRNGSNYSASLLANYLEAEQVESYTHLNGVYTADPNKVEDARMIKSISFQEAGELAEFGTSILHAKTVFPLIAKNIPLRILNTFNSKAHGTLISNNTNNSGVKAITTQEDVCIISISGRGFVGKKGIDARIFHTLSKHDISVGVVSQGSSERGVDFIIAENKAETAVEALKDEFAKDFMDKDVTSINAITNVGLITIIGQNLSGFTEAFNALIKNNIEIKLINNTLNGKNISLVLDIEDMTKASNVIHGHIFGVAKKINIAIFGKGNVGASLIDQILHSKQKILERKEINLNIFAISGTKDLLLNKKGISNDWKNKINSINSTADNPVLQVIDYAKQHHLENLIAIDNTASKQFVENYTTLVKNGFDLISSNKQCNTGTYEAYKELRFNLKLYNKQYLYETNVGAGLPLIDTIKLLHESGENITRIRGVFSGSLSFIFNKFSAVDEPFSKIVQEAANKGYTEPDAREDLCGNDVARKLLILARELDLANEFDEINIENLIPEQLRTVSLDEFSNRMGEMDNVYAKLKLNQKNGNVLRYVGDLHGNLQQEKGNLDVTLASVPVNSSLGQLKGADSLFEIYTESYGDNPIVIQGAGAGGSVTARGVFGDLLRIADKK